MVDRKTLFPTAKQAGSGFQLCLLTKHTTIEGETVREFLINVVSAIDKLNLIDNLPIPFQTSGNNYLLGYTPEQPNGVPFVNYSVYSLNNGKSVYINTNHPRFFGFRQGARLLESVGIKATPRVSSYNL